MWFLHCPSYNLCLIHRMFKELSVCHHAYIICLTKNNPYMMHFGLIFLNLLSMQRLRVLLSVQTKKCNSSSNPDAVRTLYCIGLLGVKFPASILICVFLFRGTLTKEIQERWVFHTHPKSCMLKFIYHCVSFC